MRVSRACHTALDAVSPDINEETLKQVQGDKTLNIFFK